MSVWVMRWLVTALLLHACTTAPPHVATPDTSATGASSAAPRSWTVSPEGIGPLRVGMTVAEARDALGEFVADQTPTGCSHVRLTGAPGRVLAMIVEGRVVRVEIKGGPVATTAGARVGDSETRIATLYPGRVRVEPHKYADGHYLIVSPGAGDDIHRLVFETDGRRVVEYRAGLLPEVAWVEGCG